MINRHNRLIGWSMFVMFLGLACSSALAQPAIKLTIPAADQDRRFIPAEYTFSGGNLAAPFVLRDVRTNQPVPCQWQQTRTATTIHWLVPELPAGKSLSYTLESGRPSAESGLTLTEDPRGFLSIRNADHEIARYNFGPDFAKFKKPFFYPVNVHGVSFTRAYPMENKAGENRDHVHHTGVWFNHGDVNGKDYWSRVPVTHKSFVQKSAGPVYARILAENAWGDDLTEIQDILVYDVGQDVLMDWTITLKAENGPAVLGKTKEGSFAVRVATGLTDKGDGKMVDALGNKGEPAIRAQAAPWADDYGTIDGKLVGVAIMNHPTSWRYPTNWHVRAYGLFAANPFYVRGEHKLEKGQSVTLKYRLYFHAGDPAQARVQEVFNGYANAKVVAQ